MSDRQFSAAHDRYLEPPDEEFDDTTDDEQPRHPERKIRDGDWRFALHILTNQRKEALTTTKEN